MLYSYFWVIPRRLNFICRRFGTPFHVHMWCKEEYTCTTYEDGTESVPKRRHIKFRRRGITQKQEYKKEYVIG